MKLYHGSGFNQDELMPGFKRTGKLVKWDNTESNEWLYAAITREEAVTMGFASVIEKTFDVAHYSSSGDKITITIGSGRLPTRKDLCGMSVYLYTIEKHPRSNWVLVNNATNNIEEEYKTKETLTDCIVDKVVVDVVKWMAGKNITIVDTKHAANNW